MTEHGPDQLRRALGAATDDLPVRDRGALALAEAARVRQYGRCKAVAGLAAAAVVAAVVVPLWASGGREDVAPAPSPTQTPDPDTDPDPGPERPHRGAEGRRDARRVRDLGPRQPGGPCRSPRRCRTTSPRPEQAPSVFEDRVKAIGLALPGAGRDLVLLGADNRWRSVPDTAEAAGTWPDGTPLRCDRR